MSTYFPTAFTFNSVSQTGAAEVTAVFSFQPNAGTAGYVFTSAGGETRTVLTAVAGSNYGEVVIAVDAPFTGGTWTLTCTALVTAGAPPVALVQTAHTFLVPGGPAPYLPFQGENCDAACFLRKQIPRSMQGPAWDAMIQALATGSEQPAWDNAPNVYDSLFLVSAFDYYLNRRAADMGLERPSDVPMTDNDWRRLVIALSADKLTLAAIMEVLTIFYGVESTYAHIVSTSGTFGLADGQTLDLTFDGLDSVEVVFSADDFTDISLATAQEVVAVLSRSFLQMGLKHFARVEKDNSGNDIVAIYTGTSGLQGSVLASAGAVQATLALPTTLASLLGQMRASYARVLGPAEVEVVFPATTDVVNRGLNTAAYLSVDSSVDGNSPYLSEGIDLGVAVTAVSTTLSVEVLAGHQYRLLQVASTASFPDEAGWLVLGYGWDYQTSPVPYLALAGANALALDPTFSFPSTIPAGADVRLLSSKTAPTPSKGEFWLTASPAGRIAAMSFVDFIVAAGYQVKKTVTYPSDVGLGNESYPDSGQPKLSDIVQVFGGNDLDTEIPALREET